VCRIIVVCDKDNASLLRNVPGMHSVSVLVSKRLSDGMLDTGNKREKERKSINI